MPTSTTTIFLSTVSDEFKSCRDAVAKWLDRPGTRIETQEKFMALGQTILVKLSEYIRQSDVVVHVVGDRSGNEATDGVAKPATVQHLLQVHPDLPQKLGLDASTLDALTYTQWEAWLAVYHRFEHKNLLLYIAVPSAEAPRDSLLADPVKAASQRDSQQNHLRRLAAHGRYPEFSFASSDQLCLGLVGLRDMLYAGLRSELAITNILSLSDYRDSLAGFRRFLTQAGLPFKAPPSGHPTHPEEMLKRLETSSDARGILLAGAGGVGKTRTTFETAQLGAARGWRVIYVLPGQPVVTSDKVIEAVLAHGPGKTMVVIEYLDQMQELDLGVLRRYLIQASHQRGIEFGIIANCRPGLLLKQHPERDACFDVVQLEHTAEEAVRLSVYVATCSAPKTRAALGDTELMRFCGHRPIIALLVAQQLEQLAVASRLIPENLSAVRTGDLGHWLRRRLAEDKLITPEAESIYDSASPPHHLVAAAAALACAPDEESALISAAEHALTDLGKSVSSASRIIGVLRAVGWLETEGPWLNVVHDVVADELMEQSVFELNAVRRSELKAILGLGTVRARSFGRISKTATRVAGALASVRVSAFQASLSEWLSTHAEGLGSMLAAAEPDTGAYALGAVLGGSILEDGAVEHWTALVVPWLECYGARYEARHLLFRGLCTGREDVWNALLGVVGIWLERWRAERVASFVLGPLLHHGGDRPPLEFPIVQWSLHWLEAFADKSEARYVFKPLLGRDDFKGEQVGQAVKLALQWLETFADKPEAGYVVKPLLGREKVKGEQAEQAVTLALRWLEAFADTSEAGYVLAPLLGREDVKGEKAEQVVTLALQWLETFADMPEAGYLFKPLLGREDVKSEEVWQAVKLALKWLAIFGRNETAGHVFVPLLNRPELKNEIAGQAITLAVDWVIKFVDKPWTGFVLSRLLQRSDFEKHLDAQVTCLAFQWLATFQERSDLSGLADKLLRKITLIDESVPLTLQWLSGIINKPEAGNGLSMLLRKVEVRDQLAVQLINLTFEWLAVFGASPNSASVIVSLLKHLALRDRQIDRAKSISLEWLSKNLQIPAAGEVIATLLKSEALKGEEALVLMDSALQWLESAVEKSEPGLVFRHLLRRADIQKHLATRTFRWLAGIESRPDAGVILASLLKYLHIKDEWADQVVAIALRWASLNSGNHLVGVMLARALKRSTSKREIFTLAVNWLPEHLGNHVAGVVIQRLLMTQDLPDEVSDQLMILSFQWLARFSDQLEAGDILAPLLSRRNLFADAKAIAIENSLEWLKSFVDHIEARVVLRILLKRTDMPGHFASDAISLALRWLGNFPENAAAASVLNALLARIDLTSEASTQALAGAIQWLEKLWQTKDSGVVFSVLLARQGLDVSIAARATALATRWIERFRESDEAGVVFIGVCLCQSVSVVSDPFRQEALRWCARHKSFGDGAHALILQLCGDIPDYFQRKRIVSDALSWVNLNRDHSLVGKALLALLKRHSEVDGVLDVSVALGLAIGWKFDAFRVREPLEIALELLPNGDSRRDEIEALLEYETY